MAEVDTPHSKPLNLKEATVLITGGSSGIGLGLANEFLNAGSTVIICGRRQDALEEAQKKYPALIIRQADVASPEERIQLAKWVIQHYPKVNVLVNNAGVQRQVNIVDETENWAERQLELDINISAPVHLTSLFANHLKSQPEAAIVNITSGLAFVPALFVASYSATKAYLHSFTLTTRAAFSKTNVQVVEIIPPAVKSNLGGNHDFGEPCDEFCSAVFKRFTAGEKEIGYKMSEKGRLHNRAEMHQQFEAMNKIPLNKFF